MKAAPLVGLSLLLLMVAWAATITACVACDIILMDSQPLGGDPIPGDNPIPPGSSSVSPGLLGGDPIPGDNPIPPGPE